MDEIRDEPSRYFWRWTQWSWVCVGVAVLIVLMGITGGGSVTPWIIGAIAVAAGVMRRHRLDAGHVEGRHLDANAEEAGEARLGPAAVAVE